MNPKPMLWVLLFVFLAGPACGRWNPATVQEMRNTYEHKKEKAGDRYRFVVTFCTTDYEKLLPAIPPAAPAGSPSEAWSRASPTAALVSSTVP